MLENYKDVLTVKELQSALQIGRNMAYSLVNDKVIKNIRVGSKILIPKFAVIEFLQTAC